MISFNPLFEIPRLDGGDGVLAVVAVAFNPLFEIPLSALLALTSVLIFLLSILFLRFGKMGGCGWGSAVCRLSILFLRFGLLRRADSISCYQLSILFLRF